MTIRNKNKSDKLPEPTVGIKELKTLIDGLPQDWGFSVGSWCHEQELEVLIDLLLSFIQFNDKVFKHRNPDHLDTDFHTENWIQKVIQVDSRIRGEVSSKIAAKMNDFFEAVLEVACQVRQDLYKTAQKEISRNIDRRIKRLQRILRQGKDPTIPEKD